MSGESDVSIENLPVMQDTNFGSVCLDVSIDDFNSSGFSYGDSVDIAFSNGFELKDIPYYNGYYANVGDPLLAGYPGSPYIKAALNYGDSLWNMADLAEGDTATVALKETGIYRDVQEAFDRCLKRGARAYTPRQLPPPAECIAAIHAAGGLAFWAHPVHGVRSERSMVRRFLKVLVPAGLDGIEAYYSIFTPAQTTMLEDMAREFQILRTGGTDYHGSVHAGIQLGTGCGSLNVPDELLDAMRRKLAERSCV